MKNIDKWKETKFTYDKKKRLVANEKYVNVRSLLVVNKMAKLYEKYLKDHAKGVLLDLGCGTVPLYKAYKDYITEAICIDWDKSFHKNIHLDYTADLSNVIPLDKNSVDTVLITDVLEHIHNPKNLIAEISRVICEDGKLILGVPFFYWLHETPFDFYRYTQFQLENLCEDNDLELIQIEEWGGPASIILDIVGKNLPAKLSPAYFQKFAIWLSHTKWGKKIDNRNKEHFPLGYCLIAKKN